MSNPEQSQPDESIARSEEEAGVEGVRKPSPNLTELADRRLAEQLIHSQRDIFDGLSRGRIAKDKGQQLLVDLDKLSTDLIGLSVEELRRPTIEEAQEILGDVNVSSSEEISDYFSNLVEEPEAPSVPFSIQELKLAKKYKLRLILRASKTIAGDPLTAKKIAQIAEDHFGAEELINSNVDTLASVAEDAPKLGWALVSSDYLADSTDKDYFQQTRQIYQFISEMYHNRKMPKEYKEALMEFYDWVRKNYPGSDDAMRELLAGRSDIGFQISRLKITQMFRPSTAEAAFDICINSQIDGDWPVESYFWTKDFDSVHGHPIEIGSDAKDLMITNWPPDYRDRSIGVMLSITR